MSATAAPAGAAPPPAPAKPAKGASPTDLGGPPEPSLNKTLESDFADIDDAIAKENNLPAPARKPAAAQPKAKPAEPAKPKPQAQAPKPKPAAAAAEPAKPKSFVPPKKTEPKPKPAAAAEPEVEPEPEVAPEGETTPEGGEPAPDVSKMKVPELRTAYDGLKKRITSELEPELTKLRNKIKEYESNGAAGSKQVNTKLDQLEKRNTELENEIRFVNYTKSSEFIEKYQKPYEKVWEEVLSQLPEIEVEMPDGSTRKATEADITRICNMPLGDARKAANEMFGDLADEIMAYRRNIRDLSKKQQDALDDARKNSLQRTKESELESKRATEEHNREWQTQHETIRKAEPELFDKDDSDPEGNELLEKGYELANRMFNAQAEDRPKTIKEAAELHAKIFQRAAAFDREVYRRRAWQARAEELQAIVDDYEKNAPQPGATTAAGSGGGEGGADWKSKDEAELDQLAARGGL